MIHGILLIQLGGGVINAHSNLLSVDIGFWVYICHDSGYKGRCYQKQNYTPKATAISQTANTLSAPEMETRPHHIHHHHPAHHNTWESDRSSVPFNYSNIEKFEVLDAYNTCLFFLLKKTKVKFYSLFSYKSLYGGCMHVLKHYSLISDLLFCGEKIRCLLLCGASNSLGLSTKAELSFSNSWSESQCLLGFI